MARRVCAHGGSVVRVCPERSGGLSTPRPPAEILPAKGRLAEASDAKSEDLVAEKTDVCVVQADGTDVTDAFARGAQSAWEDMHAAGDVPLAVLKANSPSCGVNLVYDGTFSGTLVEGRGVFAQLLERKGVVMATEDAARACAPSVEHPIALMLGSGLGHLAGLVKPVRRIDYRDIPGFPETARPVAGHRFEATIGTIDGVPVVVYPGRTHLYQGYSALEVTSLVRHAHRLGCRVVVFVCATGAIEGKASTGLGIISDHINVTGTNPLIGWDGEVNGRVRDDAGFVSMTDVYTPYLRGIARGVAADQGLEVGEGVLAGVLGPSFETPAEIAALGTLGASYVGMSTVCEAIMAHALGMSVLGLTLAANFAGASGVSHNTVLSAARRHANSLERLLRGIITLL